MTDLPTPKCRHGIQTDGYCALCDPTSAWDVWNALTEAQRIEQWDRRPWRRHTPKGAN